jgi:BirA family biotin operon repressor/biotin-[acetyl-CoA-carboxylase] ligase
VNLIIIPLVDSTNSYAMQLFEKGMASEGTVVLAWEQTSGRGQRGSSWSSQPGQGLYFSLILTPPSSSITNVAVLVKALAIGVAQYIANYSNDKVEIKWPNDILVKERKVCGILMESVIRGEAPIAVVAGIGINLNQKEFADDFARNPISLLQITGNHYNPETEAAILYNFLMNAYYRFRDNRFSEIEKEYDTLLFGLNQNCIWDKSGETIQAVFKGVNSRGDAMLEQEGTMLHFPHPIIRLTDPV